MIIQGFRSYRDQTVVEPFSPRHNVIGACFENVFKFGFPTIQHDYMEYYSFMNVIE